MRLIVFLVSFFCGIYSVLGTCQLPHFPDDSPIFIRSYGSKKSLISFAPTGIEIDEGEDILAYCPNGFTNEHAVSAWRLACSNGLMRKKTMKDEIDSFNQRDLDYDYNYRTSQRVNNGQPINNYVFELSCNVKSLFREGRIRYCDYGFVFGMNFDNTSKIFADVCFDKDTLEPKFFHYFGKAHSRVIENQEESVTGHPINKNFQSFDINLNDEKNAALRVMSSKKLLHYNGAVEYEMDTFIPMENLSGPFKKYVQSFEAVNKIPWWKSLKHGNWKDVEKALSSLKDFGNYEVYAGVSKTANSKYNGKCFLKEPLTFEVDDGIEYAVPLYIWNYVKNVDKEDDEVVIVGVNSPFGSDDIDDVCVNVCNKISWLEEISKLGKIIALGEVLCCEATEELLVSLDIPFDRKTNMPSVDETTAFEYHNLFT